MVASAGGLDAFKRFFQAMPPASGIAFVLIPHLDPRRESLIPIVRYAVERRMAAGKPDYWDHATVLELAILAKDKESAENALCNVLASVREIWEPKTTLRNLRLIREARERRQEAETWALEIERELEIKADQ